MDPVNKRNYDTQQRRDMADKGWALPDGSFPIADKTDLGNALQSIGRAANRTIALAHIRRRAKDLDAMDMLPDWAVSKAAVTPLSNALGMLLADSYSVYHEAHGFHWNVKGADFSQYHSLFSEITDDIYGSIDPIAENMLKINADAPFRMNELATMRTIPESAPASDPQSMATALLAQIEGLLVTLNRTFAVANSENEQGIANFLAERIDATQKWAWQLRASVGVQKADLLVLKQLYPYADTTLDQWNLLVNEVIKAGGINNVRGYAADVMRKAAGGKHFGSRSAAGAYAAHVRWGNRGAAAAAPPSPPSGGGGGKTPNDNENPAHMSARADAIGETSTEVRKPLPFAERNPATRLYEPTIQADGSGDFRFNSRNPAKSADKIKAGDQMWLRNQEHLSGSDSFPVHHRVTSVTRTAKGGVIVSADHTDWQGKTTSHQYAFHPKDKINVIGAKGDRSKLWDEWGRLRGA